MDAELRKKFETIAAEKGLNIRVIGGPVNDNVNPYAEDSTYWAYYGFYWATK